MRKIIPLITAAALSLSAVASVPVSAADTDYLLHSTFEDGKEQWSGRGSASVKAVTGISRSGEGSLYTSGRESSWNGATMSLGTDFKAGQDYAFSAYVMTEDTSSPVAFYLTLQYSDGSSTSYPKIAEVTAEKGQWAHLENNKFTIPAGAENVQLYIESEEGTKCSFYIDEVVGAPVGTEIGEPSAPVKMNKGDINYDGTIDSLDIVQARKGLIQDITDKKWLKAADADSNGVYELNDAVLIMQFVAGKITEFPVVEPVVVPGQRKYSMEEYAEIVQGMLVNNEPNDSHMKKQGVQYGTIKKETYYSKKANKNKPYNILLPAGYDESKEYPVLYVLHGFFENEDRMIITGNNNQPMYTQQIVGNAIAAGEAKDMIVVVPFVFTSATMNDATGFADPGSNEGYDNFVDDIVDSLMPHIEEKYSVKTGRENTAVTGFSMGGRESLQIGMKYGDKFGYVGAICPAPGASGSWKWNSEEETPYLVMITGGTQDDVVRLDTPQGYHNNFDRNGVPHVWHVVQNGHHGDDSIHSALYTFVRAVFQATD